jgi:hypothetical protein
VAAGFSPGRRCWPRVWLLSLFYRVDGWWIERLLRREAAWPLRRLVSGPCCSWRRRRRSVCPGIATASTAFP